MADMNALVKLAADTYRGRVKTEFTNGRDASEALRAAMIEANGGSTKLDLKKIRDGECKQLFALVETIVPVLVNEGLQGDEFFMNLVESRNLALGDSNVFTVDDNMMLVVADAAEGTQGIRRQRLSGSKSITVETQLKPVKIYEELNLVLSGRVDFNMFVDRVGAAYKKKLLDDIFAAFTAMYDNVPGTYNVAGTANMSEAEALELVEHVEAATGQKAIITGTKTAVRKLGLTNPSDKYKDDLYSMGYYGRWNGVPVVAVANRHKVGTTQFIIPNDEIWVTAGSDKPIKLVTEGETMIMMGDPMKNADLSQEFLYWERYGGATLMAEAKGRYEFSA